MKARWRRKISYVLSIFFPPFLAFILFLLTAESAHVARKRVSSESALRSAALLRLPGDNVTDVFISYKRDERATVERLAQELRLLGLNVWFDARLNSGETFSDEIDREARSSKVVLVCWSPAARRSDWVRAEALIGFADRKLAACYVNGPDGFDPPAPFNAIEVADLRSWQPGFSEWHAGWLSILRRLGQLCSRLDIERYGELRVGASEPELIDWLSAFPESPLVTNVQKLLRECRASGRACETADVGVERAQAQAFDGAQATLPLVLEEKFPATRSYDLFGEREQAGPPARLFESYGTKPLDRRSGPSHGVVFGMVVASVLALTSISLAAFIGEETPIWTVPQSRPAMANSATNEIAQEAEPPSESEAPDNLVAQYEMALDHLSAGRSREGVELLRRVAHRGFAMAQYRLAKLYEAGVGVEVDLSLAKLWTERAALSGNRRAMHDLGVFYARGEGGPVDEQAAYHWFYQAAQLGVADSQYNLGVLHTQGRGGAHNPSAALFWFLVAARQGDAAAAERAASIELELSAEQIESVRASVASFRVLPADPIANGFSL